MATKHQDGSLLEARRAQLAPPPLYKVLLLNDDFTPMDFVIVVLQEVFWPG
jgi:ATP-dependent Clp protease adaptor protein ClpS